jgi:hypothetical protein
MEKCVGGENSPSQFINNDMIVVPCYENDPSQSINNGSSAAPINLEEGGATNNGAADTSENVDGKNHKIICTSKVWQDFEPLYKTVDGKRISYGGKCHWCKCTLSAVSSSGTGHLLRHQRDCKVKLAKQGKQPILKFNPDGSMSNWDYCPDRARTQMCRLIARLDLPLNFAESPAFEEYIRLSHNPIFKKVSRQTTSRDFVKFFTDRRKIVVECLQSVTSIAITFDIWSGNAKEDYLSVVAHYVSKDWLLEKRVIGLRLIETSHTGENITDRVMTVLEGYGVVNKVFSITLNNASSNSKAMDKLRPLLSGYVGTLFLHQHCACHIINLIVKCGLKRLQPYLDSFRTAIVFLDDSNQRIAALKGYCVAMNVRPRKFGIDMTVRWNSTYLMLKHLVPYKETFGVFIDTNYPRKLGEPNMLTNSHWFVTEKLLEFLELFYDATVTLSGVYYPTYPLIMHNILDII